ncbi:DUF4229 domain-containing protein [Agrococcus sp. Ld7]|uniref:DUF4229 domain-containing protein n=1 Tax=Agrococcus sp. Ld7 TaxID=649148 RepID=UPI00386771E0
MSPSMRYLIVRALLFITPFTLLMVAQVPWPLSALVSVAFAFAASIVFFRPLRNEAAADLQRIREGRKRDGAGPDDADIEDSLYAEPRASATASPADPPHTAAAHPADPAAPAAAHPADAADPEHSATPADPASPTNCATPADPAHPTDPDASARP